MERRPWRKAFWAARASAAEFTEEGLGFGEVAAYVGRNTPEMEAALPPPFRERLEFIKAHE